MQIRGPPFCFGYRLCTTASKRFVFSPFLISTSFMVSFFFKVAFLLLVSVFCKRAGEKNP